MSTPDRIDADVLVIGGGMAGAIAALAAAAEGARVVLARRAPGATALSSGAIGVAPGAGPVRGAAVAKRRAPTESAHAIAARQPDHPYAILGPAVAQLGEALRFAAKALEDVLAPFDDRARFLATPYGTVLECALCQRSMVAGDLADARGPIAVVGFRGHLGWDADLVAAGVRRFEAPSGPEVVAVEAPLFTREEDAIALPHALARALEPPGAAERAGEAIRQAIPTGTRLVLLPPVLGLEPSRRVPERVAAAAGVFAAETTSTVPSVPGLRLDGAVARALAGAGVRVVAGAVEPGSRPGEVARIGGRDVAARAWVLATGRFVGGGIVRRGELREPVLGIPVLASEGDDSGFHLAQRPAASLTTRQRTAAQPLLAAGLRVDASLRPLGVQGAPVHERVFAAGAVIGGHEHAGDGTGLGVAILTGWLAGRSAAVFGHGAGA